MKIGILGTGIIAGKMAETVNRMKDVQLYAVASRTESKAHDFAVKFGAKKYYDSYEALADDENIDLIYIATPHSRHFQDSVMCLEKGRNILCEKPFTVNASQAEKVFELAEKRNLFAGEAMWTRFMPMRFTLDKILSENPVGRITSLTANTGYSIAGIERIKNPDLAGGALLDVGIYPLNFAAMVFGHNITDVRSSCVKNEYGVDMQNSIILTFNDSETALLHSTVCANTDLLGVIYGENGRIEFRNINNCEGITVIQNNGERTEYLTPESISGYEYEVEAACRAITERKTECTEMPHSETLFIMKLMDRLRNDWNIVYPFE